ncbi:hypothetical protein D9615_004397 [Tricholomella constricta]|uniref:Uncharacterized protein n=1 Tax=Tricholomella constricta TaxID=117010 RepID=A0A8H5HF64_9AGAR|nr:hypothetical protein D9615_004397 [Tricholomella constricta]
MPDQPNTPNAPRPSPLCSRRRPYERSKISKLKKSELIALVKKQPDHWPRKGKSKGINGTKTKREDVLEALLNPEYGFTSENTFEAPTSAASSPLTPADSESEANRNRSTPAAGPSAFETVLAFPRPEDPSQMATAHQVAATKDLTIYIEDRRFPDAASQTMEVIDVSVADRVGCGPGAWRVSGKEVIAKLQCSHGAIGVARDFARRPVRLGIPEHNDPKSRFTRYFATAAVSDLPNVSPSPEYLTVPSGMTPSITICVNWATDLLSPSLEDSDTIHVGQGNKFMTAMSHPTHARGSSQVLGASGGRTARRKAQVSGEVDVAWLKERVRERPGFEDFRKAKGRVLQNPEIVDNWKFAVQVKNTFYNTPSGVSDHILTKKSILTALGVRETWFSQAEHGFELAQLYGKDGDCCADEVVAKLAERQAHPLGQQKLLEFLNSWAAREHAQE